MSVQICTVGTQGQHDTSFITLLRCHNVDAVIDIRLRNEGRYYRFASGRHISALLEESGIVYRHDILFAPTAAMFSSFKLDGNWDRYVHGYTTLFAERRMGEIWNSRYALFRHPCLLCAEHVPLYCHRRLLADSLAREFGLTVTHLPCGDER